MFCFVIGEELKIVGKSRWLENLRIASVHQASHRIKEFLKDIVFILHTELDTLEYSGDLIKCFGTY